MIYERKSEQAYNTHVPTLLENAAYKNDNAMHKLWAIGQNIVIEY